MILPRGNPLIEKKSLPFPDINVMVTNLQQQSFTGYVKLELPKGDGVIFCTHGAINRSIEMEESNNKVQPMARLLNKIKKKEVNISTYVLSTRIVGVLSLIFSFQPLYLDYEVKQKELKKVMTTLETDKYTGIIEVVTRDGTSYMLIDRGELVTDSFASEYGQIICGNEAVSRFLNFVSEDGAVINIYAEKQEEIDEKLKTIHEDLEKIKQLIAREEKGFFKAGDTFWVDEFLVQDWKVESSKNLQIEVETPDGSIHIVKGAVGKKLGGYITATASYLKKLKLKEGDLVSVKPILS